jgi:hypothetical protein
LQMLVTIQLVNSVFVLLKHNMNSFHIVKQKRGMPGL